MRAIRFIAIVIGSVCVACGGDTGDDPGGRGDNNVHHGLIGGTGGAGPSDDGSFGNSSAGVNVPAIPMSGAMGAAGSAAPCEVGKFCAPTTPDPKDCGTLTLETSVKMITTPGNVLLIWDRSTSMTENWNGMQRWQGAGSGMINALTSIQDLLTIGAIFFPAEAPGAADETACLVPGCSCNVDDYASPEQLPFTPGATALQKLQAASPSGVSPMYGPVGVGATTDPNATATVGQTPTSEAIAAADVMLMNSTLTGITAAVLVTDGEPNCAWDQAKTTTTVANWLSALNIKTYVVGLPGAAGGATAAGIGGIGPGGLGGGPPGVVAPGQGATILNAIAQAGGTNQYIDAADAMTLQTALMNIISSTLQSGFDSCSIDLTPAADPADKLQLVLTEKVMGVPTDEAAPHDLGNGGGWTITPDGVHVELTGSLCTDAMGGRFDALKFTYGCKELPPLPPVPPVE